MRTARVKIIELRNDLKDTMDAIGRALEGVYDPAKEDAGFKEDMTYDHDARKIDPRQGDGLYYGPSSGHVNLEKAGDIGMGGMYGYGASMNAWHVDYVAYWAGHNGFIWHSNTQ